LYFAESDEEVREQERDWVVGSLVEVSPSEPGEVNQKAPSEMSGPKVAPSELE
jgi:hypothetical protein